MPHQNILPLYPSSNILIEKAEGCHLVDAEGNIYLDLESGVWCANLGHGHARINRVIKNQLNRCMHHGYRFTNNYCSELSAKLLGAFNFKDGKTVFLSSGSEAVNLAITFARHITGRNKIAIIGDSYVSAYGYGGNIFTNQEIIRLQTDNPESLGQYDLSEVAAFVFEPGIYWGLIRIHPNIFVQKVSGIVKSNGGIIVIDEVTTGFGRTGKWFGYQHYTIKPDIVATGKGLGNGYPISAVSVNKKIADLIESSGLRYAQSHQNDPLGCAVGLEVINILEQEALVEKSLNSGNYLMVKLSEVVADFPEIEEIRGLGLMVAIVFRSEEKAGMVFESLFNDGFAVGYKHNVIRLMPPLIISRRQIDFFLKALTKALN